MLTPRLATKSVNLDFVTQPLQSLQISLNIFAIYQKKSSDRDKRAGQGGRCKVEII